MLKWAIACFLGGLVIDFLESLYVYYNHSNRKYAMTSIGALMGILRLTVYSGIIQQGIEKGFIFILLFAAGNWCGGVLSFSARMSQDSVSNKKPSIIET